MPIQAPYYPIVYVRGYAGGQGEVEDTVATPYMGFNLGATKLRQLHTGKIETHVFESPLIRLMKDYEYHDAYHEGQIKPQGPVPPESVWIFRYYDITSEDIGKGERKEIEFHARRLREFILHVRSCVLKKNEDPSKFRVHLVAHSMGGLVCRAYLQNSAIPDLAGQKTKDWAKKGVDRFFTYATPHGGIEFRSGLGWVEGLRDFLDVNNSGNFGPKRMRQFLDLKPTEKLTSLGGRYPADRVFCLVGTNSEDYGAAGGLSKKSVGPLSDGLVMIKNAVVDGAPRAFIHRTHSGHYGIVNSESGYQNLTRFLFGNVRVDGSLEVKDLSLPPEVQKEHKKGRKVRASYHFETVVRVRGEKWDLHRRLTSEGSAVFRTFDEMMRHKRSNLAKPRWPRLFSTFLSLDERVNEKRKSLGFCIDLGVLVPDYEVDGFWFFDSHFDGGYLFRDKINLEVTPPEKGKPWTLRYGMDSVQPNGFTDEIAGKQEDDAVVFRIPVERKGPPGISADLKLVCARVR